MGKKTNTTRAIKLMSSSTAVGQVAMITRQWVIFNAIGAENYGIALPMMLSIDLLNRLMEMNPGAIVVQDKKGSTRRFRDALQFLSVSRGILFFLILLMAAVPLAIFNELDSMEYILGFLFVSLIPLIRGLSHQDIFRQMRRRQFGKLALSSAMSPATTTTIVVILSLFMNTFWLPLLARFIDAIVGVIVSFVIAERKWRMRYDRQSTIRIIKFVLPLIVGGVAIFISNRGSQQLLSASDYLFGYEIPKSVVGSVAAAVTIAMIPGTIGDKLITQVFPPKIAEISRQGGSVSKVFEQMQAVGFTLGASALILLQAGSVIVPIVFFGNSYDGVAPFLIAMSVFGALRLSSNTTKAVALGMGKSKIMMYANFWAIVGFIGSFWVVYNQRDLVEIGYCMAISEILSYISRSVMIKRIVPSISLKTLFVKPAIILGCALAVGTAQRYAIAGLPIPLAVVVVIVSIAIGSGVLALFWAPVRQIVSRKLAL